MDKSRLETKVGLFVSIGLALLAVLLIYFSKGTSLFHGTYELRLHAGNVGGLKLRAGVLLAGVQVGSVSDIKLANDGKSVTILLNIYKEDKIYHDARFVIEQSGFLGDQYVSIVPTTNSPPLLQDGADVDCQEPFNLQEVARSTSGFIKRIDETVKKLDDSITDLRRVVLNENTLTNFSAAVINMRTFSEQAINTVNDINAFIATNGSQASLAVSNVVFFSQELMRLANAAEGVLATNSTDITTAVKNIESSTEVLKSLLSDAQSGKGLAGTMLQNEQLATNVQAIANNLAIASSNLNRLGLWHFLWHREPLRTNLPPASPTSN
ncbi:MAG: MlaD family protein [Verrucomicrobiota bacterium]|jgi:phospholipid/cholesterol/gamma-HCH transport system substrate-binding protein